MWGDWDAIEAAQAEADRKREDRPKLRVVPDEPTSFEEAIARHQPPPVATWPPRQPRDDAERHLLRSQGFGSPDAAQEALDALERFLGALLPDEEDTDG